MQTIEKQWLEYKEHCIPFGTPERVIKSVRSTFYAGALSVLTIIRDLKGATAEQTNETIDGMFEEMTEFSVKLNE